MVFTLTVHHFAYIISMSELKEDVTSNKNLRPITQFRFRRIRNPQHKTGQLIDPRRNGKTQPCDPFVPRELIKRFKIKKGSFVEGKAQKNDRFANPKVRFVETIDAKSMDARKGMYGFQQLTTVAPNDNFTLRVNGRLTTRIIDLFCPIGKGTQGLIVAPPRTGKTTLLHDIAHGGVKTIPNAT